MTNIVNFERDMFFTSRIGLVSAVGTTFSTSSALSAANDGIVGQRFSSFQGSLTTTVGTGASAFAVGCLILAAPDGDAVPYRFKGSCNSSGAVSWCYGYRSSGNSVKFAACVGFGSQCDELVYIPPLDSGDADYGNPVCFFLAVLRPVAEFVVYGGSAQRLISKPPQFATAVS